jgi:ATP-dependent protease ClpP protease subunit
VARRTRHEALITALLARRPLASRYAPREVDSQGRTWYRIENRDAGSAAPVEVYLYAEIGMWGVTADMFLDELAPLGSRDITLRINSEGGEVFDGVAIYNALQRHGGRINAHVDGLAASAASFIAMAADEIVMEPGAQMMIHDAIGMCYGNEAEMERMRDMLARTSDTIAMIYAERAGGSPADWREVMRGERWYDGPAAVSAKLADRVGEGRARDVSTGQKTPDNRIDAGQSLPVNLPVSAPATRAPVVLASGRERRTPTRRPRAVRARPGTRATAAGLPITWNRDLDGSQLRGEDGKWAETPGTGMSWDAYNESYDVHDESLTDSGLAIVTMSSGEMQLAFDDADDDSVRHVMCDFTGPDDGPEELRDALREAIDSDTIMDIELTDPTDEASNWAVVTRNEDSVTLFIPGAVQRNDFEIEIDIDEAEQLIDVINEQISRVRDLVASPADTWNQALIALTTPEPVSSASDDQFVAFWEASA